MRLRKYTMLLLLTVLFCDSASSQETAASKDSTLIYRSIETYSKRSRVASFVYRLVFNPVSTISGKKVSVKNNKSKKLVQKPYSIYEGKIVRNINIVTLDPFGYSANDTTVAIKNIFYKVGNEIHIKTKNIAILNLLLFRKNRPFNSLNVKESERLIRSQKYVHDVSLFVKPAGRGKSFDSVDVFIRVLDAWSIIPYASISSSGIRLDINDKNFIGTGNEFQNAYSKNLTNGINAFSTIYSIPNIRNTYINSRLHYSFDGYKNFNKSFAVDRPFFSPLAKWAAGISFTSLYKTDSLSIMNLVFAPSHFRFRAQDYWAGKAIQVFKGTTENERFTNLILSVRYMRIRYMEKPSVLYDPFQVYSNEDFYLGSIGISTRKYVQDKYIFKYGITEDVPIGKVYGLTGGWQVRNNISRLYLGTRYSSGKYLKWGYLSSDVEFGIFFNSSHVEQGVVTAGLNYFTGIIDIGKWKLRQFVKPQVMIGVKRFYFNGLTLNDNYGIGGFNSPVLSGSNRLVVTLQTQSYSPWNFIGFRFGPYLTYSFGMLGDADTRFKNSKVYSQIGLGVLINNANLVFNTFQFSVSFFPLIPGIGRNIFKTNSFRTTDFGFRDFEIGKPAMVVYQ